MFQTMTPAVVLMSPDSSPSSECGSPLLRCRWANYDTNANQTLERDFRSGAWDSIVHSSVGGMARLGAVYRVSFSDMEQVGTRREGVADCVWHFCIGSGGWLA